MRERTRSPISGVSGAPAQSTSCAPRVDQRRRVEQVLEPLLVRDAADEDDVRRRRVDAVALEHVGAVVGLVLLRVDAVVDHLHARRVDRRVALEHVVAHRAGDGDDRVRVLERGALAERREVVAAAELLLLPGPQRLEAVRRRDVRDAVVELRQVAGEVRVPRVRVDELRRRRRRRSSRGRRTSSRARRCPSAPPTAGTPSRRSRSAPKQWTVRSTSSRSSRARYSTCTPAPP